MNFSVYGGLLVLDTGFAIQMESGRNSKPGGSTHLPAKIYDSVWKDWASRPTGYFLSATLRRGRNVIFLFEMVFMDTLTSTGACAERWKFLIRLSRSSWARSHSALWQLGLGRWMAFNWEKRWFGQRLLRFAGSGVVHAAEE